MAPNYRIGPRASSSPAPSTEGSVLPQALARGLWVKDWYLALSWPMCLISKHRRTKKEVSVTDFSSWNTCMDPMPTSAAWTSNDSNKLGLRSDRLKQTEGAVTSCDKFPINNCPIFWSVPVYRLGLCLLIEASRTVSGRSLSRNGTASDNQSDSHRQWRWSGRSRTVLIITTVRPNVTVTVVAVYVTSFVFFWRMRRRETLWSLPELTACFVRKAVWEGFAIEEAGSPAAIFFIGD